MFLDLPGIDDSTKSRGNLQRRLLPFINAVVLVTHVSRANDQTFYELLQYVENTLPGLPLIVFITHVDLLVEEAKVVKEEIRGLEDDDDSEEDSELEFGSTFSVKKNPEEIKQAFWIRINSLRKGIEEKATLTKGRVFPVCLLNQGLQNLHKLKLNLISKFDLSAKNFDQELEPNSRERVYGILGILRLLREFLSPAFETASEDWKVITTPGALTTPEEYIKREKIKKLKQLIAMGFEKDAARKALNECGWNFEDALDRLSPNKPNPESK
jgi:hypothetical protein